MIKTQHALCYDPLNLRYFISIIIKNVDLGDWLKTSFLEKSVYMYGSRIKTNHEQSWVVTNLQIVGYLVIISKWKNGGGGQQLQPNMGLWFLSK